MTALGPFSLPLTPPFRRWGEGADVGAVVAERRAAFAAATEVAVWAGTLHDTYPQTDHEPVFTINDLDLIARLASAVFDRLPEQAALGDPESDLILDFPDEDGEQWMLRVAGGRIQDAYSGAAWLVDPLVLTEALAATGSPEQYLPSTPDTPVGPWPPGRSPAGVALTQLWLDRLPDSRPITHELKWSLQERWIRFHSLPESQRYAEDEADYLEILRRHQAVLEALAGDRQMLLVTFSGGDDLAVTKRPALIENLTAGSWFWESIAVEESEDASPWCAHLWVEHVNRGEARLDQLLRMVADDYASIILADPGLRWLFVPYDGGVDVIAADQAHRDQLKAQFQAWVPAGRY